MDFPYAHHMPFKPILRTACLLTADALTLSMPLSVAVPLAEATAAGLPVIAPAGGAAEEVVDPVSAVLVASSMRERARGAGGTRGTGAVIDVDQEALAAAIEVLMRSSNDDDRSAAEAQAQAMYGEATGSRFREAAKRGPLWAEQRLSMRHSADRVLAAVMRAAAACE